MVIYEWVVEEIDPNSEELDILDCSYWPENEQHKALEQANAMQDNGKVVDFGLCRRVVFDDDRDGDRGYLYKGPSGWPDRLVFDNGAAVPKRLYRMLAD